MGLLDMCFEVAYDGIFIGTASRIKKLGGSEQYQWSIKSNTNLFCTSSYVSEAKWSILIHSFAAHHKCSLKSMLGSCHLKLVWQVSAILKK